MTRGHAGELHITPQLYRRGFAAAASLWEETEGGRGEAKDPAAVSRER